MHICCANCALYPVKSLREKGIEPHGFWFNPNIHPAIEYRHRLNALRTLQSLWGLEVNYIDRYGLDEFMNAVNAHNGIRCEVCYRLRLDATASFARDRGFDGFTTSLLVSPYQKFDLIVEIGMQMEKRHSVRFYFEDFRAGYKEGVRLSKELGLYRQKYCGCVFSMSERFNLPVNFFLD